MHDVKKQALATATEKTAFILGNGPSLRGVSLPSLNKYATIGMNAAYRFWYEIDWRPRYYACLDDVVGLSHKNEIARLIDENKISKFLLRNNLIEELGVVAAHRCVINFDALKTRDAMFWPQTITTGSHSALWAASMGYDQIVLLGIDGRYKEIVEGAERRDGIQLEITKEEANPNYFFDGYQQKGDRYNIPNPRPNLHVGAWRDAAIRLNGMQVSAYNCNQDSAVRFFPFIDLEKFLEEGATPKVTEETILSEAETVKASAQTAKVLHFWRANKILTSIASFIFAISIASVVLNSEALGANTVVALFSFAAVWFVFMGLTYLRHVTIARLNAMQQEMTGLRARIADLERIQRGL